MARGLGYLRRAARILAATALVVVVVLAFVWWAFRVPTVAVPPRRDVVLADVVVVNPGTDRAEHRTVEVADGRIRGITTATPGGDPRFAGAYVLPGLIDMHVHQSLSRDHTLFGLLYLSHGVTAVRDTGGDASLRATARRIRQGELPGPRVFGCGPILDGDPPLAPGAWIVRTREEAGRAVDALADAGAHCVKIYEEIAPEPFAAVREAAARHALPVIGHVPRGMAFEHARLADVQHLTGVPTLPRNGPPATTMAEWVANWAKAWRAVDDERIDFVVRTSHAQGVIHTPTTVVWTTFARLARPEAVFRDPFERLRPRYYRELLPGLLAADVSPGSYAMLGDVLAIQKRVVRRLKDAGVRIQAGTDTPYVVPGASLQEELRSLVAIGFTPEEALGAATRVPGDSLPLRGQGRIEAGAPADLLVFREDPTRDLANLATLEAVIADGRFYSRDLLDAALARQRAAFEGAVFDRVSVAVARLAVWVIRRRAEGRGPAGA